MVDYDYEFMSEDDEDFYPDFYPDNYALVDEENKISPWNDQEGLPPMSAYQLYYRCVEPTITDGLNHIVKTLIWCLVFRLTTQTVTIPKQITHLLSFTCGTVVLYQLFDKTLSFVLVQGVLAYLSLWLSSKFIKRHNGWICMISCIAFLLLCELFIVDPVKWHMIRAAQMLVAMRAISVGFQLDENVLQSFPGMLSFFGYLFNVGTVAFGPWIPYNKYLTMDNNTYKLWLCIANVFWALVKCLVFLSISACWTLWLVPNAGTSKWLLAYRDAFSFRSSHYFVSYLSEATAMTAGLDLSNSGDWSVTTTRPLKIEFPRSLVEVVIHWNVPMHSWLKQYVFRVARPYGTFLAILGTYVLSALLHGLNFQLGIVLLSLGFYTYIEHVTRLKLASVFSACIKSRKCGPECEHQWKETHWAVRLANMCLSCMTVFHLAYLGLMFDSSKLQEEGYSLSHALKKWKWLSYSSHWLMLGTFIFYWLV